jgi:hypothetical protein
MGLRRTTLVLLAVALVALAGTVTACKSDSATTTSTSEQATVSSQSTTSISQTTTTEEPRGSSVVLPKVGDVAEVEQGELSVDKVTVTDDLASAQANALLLTGVAGESKNVSKKAAEGSEFLMITFKYKKAAWYEFRGGIYPDDIKLVNGAGVEYAMVETKGYGGIFESNAGKVPPDVEAYTTAVYEVPKGETGLKLIYHEKAEDGFTCAIR